MKKQISTVDLTKMALLTALLCVSAYIVIPLPFSPVPFTAQTVVVNMIGLLLAPWQAVVTILVYILLGLVGLPVFSGGMGGPGKLFGPTGGYIFAWLLAVWLISMLKGQGQKITRWCMITIAVGIPVIYIVGSIYMKVTMGMTWGAVLMAAVVPYIPLDIGKCVGAAFISKAVYSGLSKRRI